MSLYEIIKAVQNAQGAKAKESILVQHKGNELLKEFMRCVNSPAINFYQKKIAKHHYEGEQYDFTKDTLDGMIYHLAERNITGRQAERWLGALFAAATDESKMLIKCIIDKSVGASVGETIVLKVWPELFFTVPYQRCSLLDAKAKERFANMPLKIIQEKLDGSFCYLVKETGKPAEAITRAGSKYPKEFAEKLARGVPDGVVLVGELLVYASEYSKSVLLDRKTGNGILNSVLKSGDEGYEHLSFQMTAWDILTPEEFKAGKSDDKYSIRYANMKSTVEWGCENVVPVETFFVKTMEEAYAIYSDYLQKGSEGCVLKNPDALWKDGTSKDMVKMKITFEAEYVVTGIFEGEGKYKGMLGGYNIETSDGLLKSSVGTGFTDAMRKNPPAKVGDIITVIANDVISRRDSPFKSLFLPVYSETRLDKKEADSLARVMEQLNAAKGL